MMNGPLVTGVTKPGVETHPVDHINAFVDQPMTPEQIAEVYDSWANSYDEDLARAGIGYNVTRHLTDAFGKLMPPEPQSRILDIACGTGLVAERLQDMGYPHVDGVDGSSGMLEVARHKGLYKNLYCEFVTNEPLKCAKPRTYDALLTSGSLLPNHLTSSCLRHLAALVKPGGYFGIAMRKQFQMEPELLKLQSEGLWQFVVSEEKESCYRDQSGMIYLMRVK